MFSAGHIEFETFLSTPSARRATNEPPELSAEGSISIHALRKEGDGVSGGVMGVNKIFLSTPSARRATVRPARPFPILYDFYPRPPRGGRPMILKETPDSLYFYPRPPRGGRPGCQRVKLCPGDISIHALREEGDRAKYSPVYSMA